MKPIRFDLYLTSQEGLQAVYKYCEIYKEPLTNETAAMINRLCFSDPFFISCVVKSRHPSRDLTTALGVTDAVNFEKAEPPRRMRCDFRECRKTVSCNDE